MNLRHGNNNVNKFPFCGDCVCCDSQEGDCVWQSPCIQSETNVFDFFKHFLYGLSVRLVEIMHLHCNCLLGEKEIAWPDLRIQEGHEIAKQFTLNKREGEIGIGNEIGNGFFQ